MRAEAKAVMRSARTAALGSTMDGAPYVSLVLIAFDPAGAPLLLLSGLAQHTRNLEADPRLSLLFDGTTGLDEPLTGPRLTVMGVAQRTDDPAALAAYLDQHPGAAQYAGFSDFRLYRVEIQRAHFVAGFGKIAWVRPADLV